MLRKTASALAACAISALLIAAAPSAPGSAAPPHLTIVSSLPRTGSANSQTTSIVNGIKMAIEERSGKIGEFEIRYEDMDDASPQKGNWEIGRAHV